MLSRLCSRSAFAFAIAIASASTLALDPPQRPFTLHWAGGNGPGNSGEAWRDWAGAVNFGTVPMQRNMVVLYQSEAGLYPVAGVHQVEADPDWMRRHFIRLGAWVQQSIPDPNFSGYAVIDYEQWEWCWAMLNNAHSNQGPDARDFDFKDDWRDFIRQSNPSALQGAGGLNEEAVFERTYNDAVRRFLTATINECRRLRPHAKWGFYNSPPKSYYAYVFPERVAPYRTMLSRDLQWMVDVSDALFPDVYALCYTIPDAAQHASYQDFESSHRTYVAGNIQTAIQMARGKPVIAFYWLRYHDSTGPYAYTFVSDLNLRIALDVCKREGANGMAIWEAFNSTAALNQFQQFYTTSATPLMMQYITDSAGNLGGQGTQPPQGSGSGDAGGSGAGTGSGSAGGSSSAGGGSGSNASGSNGSGGASSDPNPLETPYVNVRPTEPTGSNNNGDSTNRDEVNDRRDARGNNAANSGGNTSGNGSGAQGGGSPAGGGSNGGPSNSESPGPGGSSGGSAGGGGSGDDPNVSARRSGALRDRSERRAAEIRHGNIVANAVANNGRQGRGAQRFSRPATVSGTSTTDGRRP